MLLWGEGVGQCFSCEVACGEAFYGGGEASFWELRR